MLFYPPKFGHCWSSSLSFRHSLRNTLWIILNWKLTASWLFLGFPGGPSGKELNCQYRRIRDMGSILGLGRSPAGGHGNSLQYSCLENPVDRGVWRATVHGVTKSQTWLSDLKNMQLPLLGYRWPYIVRQNESALVVVVDLEFQEVIGLLTIQCEWKEVICRTQKMVGCLLAILYPVNWVSGELQPISGRSVSIQ